MNTKYNFKEFFARTYSILQIHSHSFLSKKVFVWFYKSTLLIKQKIALLRLIPRSEMDMKWTLVILESNYVIGHIQRRNQELDALYATIGESSTKTYKIHIEKIKLLTI